MCSKDNFPNTNLDIRGFRYRVLNQIAGTHAISSPVIRQQSRSNHFITVMTAAARSPKPDREKQVTAQVPQNVFKHDC